ncbi:unnamed protein product, partial [Medioppia subpectinata]
PYLLFIDEPTTGLDTHSALTLTQCLRQLSRKNNMSIITSIHQPNNDLFNMFDNIYVLANGGVCLYSGVPHGLRQRLSDCQIECNENQVPIEVLITLSFNGLMDTNVITLCDKTRELTINMENTVQMNEGFKFVAKPQLLLFIGSIIFMANCFNKNIGRADGCVHIGGQTNKTCMEIEDEKTVWIHACVICVGYGVDMQIIILENSNIMDTIDAHILSQNNYLNNTPDDNISGCAAVNSLNALMGPSGAGKTMLLKCLNGQNNRGLSTDTKFYATNRLRYKTCFIMSEVWEHLLPGLTVRQTLLYASRLKNSGICIELNHNKIVTDLMSELAIGDTADNWVETCSGGEQKRIVIACELTSHIKPNMLCIDEPTSGLDSNAAQVIINCLKVLSRKHGMTIIASIHQPNYDLFHTFDSIYVLANGGVCLYSGAPHRLRQHLADNGIECQESQVPIDVLIKVASDTTLLATIGVNTGHTYDNGVHLDANILSANMRLIAQPSSISKRFAVRDTYYLLGRMISHGWQRPRQWVSQLLQFILLQSLALLMVYTASDDMIAPDGCVELSFGADCTQNERDIYDEKQIKHNMKFNFMLLLIVAFIALIVMSVTFGADFCVFRGQQHNGTYIMQILRGWYSTGAYLWSRTIVDLIPVFISVPVFCWIANLYNTYTHYVMTVALNLLVILCMQSVAQLSALAFVNEPKLGLTLAIIVFVVTATLGNNLISVKQLHYTLQAVSQLSCIRLAYECLMMTIYGFDRCQGNQMSTVLYAMSIDDDEFWPNIINLVLVTVTLKALTFVCTFLKTYKFGRRKF